MSDGSIRQKQRRSGRRGTMVVLGLLLIGGGLVVFRYSADIAGRLDSYISPPPDNGSNITGLVSPGSWYLPLAVWGFGFTLIGLGGTMLRSAFVSAVMGGGRGAMEGGPSMSPDALETYMQQALSTSRGAGLNPAPTTSPKRPLPTSPLRGPPRIWKRLAAPTPGFSSRAGVMPATA